MELWNAEIRMKHKRVADFMRLFTEEELDQWRGPNKETPNWIVEGILWFMDQEPEHRALMERLAKDD